MQSSLLLFSALLIYLAPVAVDAVDSFGYFLAHEFVRKVIFYKNGGEESVPMTINACLDDFAWIKARIGCKLNYIPEDCTTYSDLRPRLPLSALRARGVAAEREPDVRCGLTTWTDRLRVFAFDSGEELENLYEAKDGDRYVVVPAGDHFVWPAGVVGDERGDVDVGDDAARVRVRSLSSSPLVFQVENFASEDEVDALIASAKLHQSNSEVRLECRGGGSGSGGGGGGDNDDDVHDGGATSCALQNRLAALLRLPYDYVADNSSPFNVRHSEATAASTAHLAHYSVDDRIDSRFVTSHLFLNDVQEGGEIIFPYGGGAKHKAHALDAGKAKVQEAPCSNGGLTVKPKKGSLVFWYNLYAEGNNHDAIPNPVSFHGSCDVIKGEQWSASKSIRNRMFNANINNVVAAASDDDETATAAAVAEAIGKVGELGSLMDKLSAAKEALDRLKQTEGRVEQLQKLLEAKLAAEEDAKDKKDEL